MPAKTSADLKRSITSLRGWLTRDVRDLDELCDATKVKVTGAVARSVGSDLREGMDRVKDRIASLELLEAQYVDMVDEGEIEGVINEAADFKKKARKSLSVARDLLAAMDSDSDVRHRQEGSNSSQVVKLPELKLPTFDGTYSDWQPFWDQYKAMIDDSNLATVSKFTYLRTLLKGEALASIGGFTLTDANYRSAVELLEKRYGRKERLIFAHLQDLMSIEADKKVTTKRLWELQDKIVSHIRSLESLGVSGENYGVILTPVLLSRLPPEIRMEWARKGEGKESDLKFLLEFLSSEVQRRERSQVFEVQSETHSQSAKPKSVPTAAALSTSTSSESKCEVCSSKKHATERCFQLTKVTKDERKELMLKHGLCFKCLAGGHRAASCEAKCSKCQGAHHQLLCRSKADGQTTKESKDTETKVKVESCVNLSQQEIKTVVMQTAEVEVVGSHETVTATVLFDTGSDRTYVSSKLVNRVQPPWVRSESFRYTTFGSSGAKESDLRSVFHLSLRGERAMESMEVMEVPVICAPLVNKNLPAHMLPKLKGVKVVNQVNPEIEIDILIGLDNYWRMMTSEVEVLSDNLAAQRSKFGWVVSGVSGTPDSSVQTNLLSCQLFVSSEVTDQSLRRFWELESVGISGDETKSMTDAVLTQFNETTEFQDGRYLVSLPWKDNSLVLQDNKTMAERRLGSLDRKLDKDPHLKMQYNAYMAQMEESGVIEEVPPSEIESDGKVFYLPHHPVVRESSTTTRVRPVFDASAAGNNGVSLNDCLEVGPSLLPLLVDVLIRFRRWPIALSADITKAFLQVAVKKEDCDVHRFLWNDNGTVRTMRFRRVPFGNCCSPFLLNATLKLHVSSFPDSKAVEELLDNLYVDDWLSGADTPEDACKLFEEAYNLLKEANMVLAKFSTNDDDVSVMFEKFDEKFAGGSTSSKVLGLQWNQTSDSFMFTGFEVPTDVMVTKRLVVSVLSRMFDPLGLLTPFTMTLKILVQDLWILGCDWDQPVPEDVRQKFVGWLRDLEVVRNWSIPRCYFSFQWNSIASEVELHAFGDASERGYGSVVYLRVPNEDGTYAVSLVVSKARVSPVKRISLPRLELMAALMTARLLKHVMEALRLPAMRHACYSDSMVTLSWIKGAPARWKTFVANRVTEIQQLTDPSVWRFCDGESNPADAVSRGVKAQTLTDGDWLSGPIWLRSEFEPKVISDDVLSVHHGGEVRVQSSCVNLSIDTSSFMELFDRCSSFPQLLRTVAWMLRFQKNSTLAKKDRMKGDLSYVEISQAKKKVFWLIQQEAFAEEIVALEASKSIPRSSKVLKLSPFLDDEGLLRVGTRLQFSELSYEEKFPILLPKCHVTLLMVRFQHKIMQHAGVLTLVTQLRSDYWIVGLRQMAKKVTRNCVSCKRYDSRPFQQVMAPLPGVRSQRAPPFSVVGVDHAGPLFCVDTHKKLYILLFTCAVTRAVHLELVDSLSAEDTVLALRRFFARRGLPTIIYSDNAKGFKAAKTLLEKQMYSIEWRYIVPQSPWWGGWWERLVRSTKSSLRKTVGRRRLTRCELETNLHSIEAILNDRPLTFVSDEASDQQILCPAHFLIGRSGSRQCEETGGTSRRDLVERKKMQDDLLEEFWTVWSNAYIRELPVLGSRLQKKRMEEGAVVLVEEPGQKRGVWPMGVIIKCYEGRDGLCRAVDLRTPTGVLKRPIQRLHDLELTDEDDISRTRTGRVIRPQ